MLQAARKFSDDQQHPWVVHCSAGIGRTGSFIAVDHGLRMFEQGSVVSVLDIIRSLRKDRGGMVQHWEQAEFVQNTLQAYVEEHGSNDMNTILRKSVQRAANIVPPNFVAHPSQENTDEGDEDRIPEWRQEQLAETEAMKREKILELQMANTLGRKKAEHLASKENAKQSERERIEEMLQLDDDGEEDFLSYVGTLKVGRGRSTRARPSIGGEAVSDDEDISDDPISEDEEEPGTLQRDTAHASRLVQIKIETESIGAPTRRNTPDVSTMERIASVATQEHVGSSLSPDTSESESGNGRPRASVRLGPSESTRQDTKVENSGSICGFMVGSTQWLAVAMAAVLAIALIVGVVVGVTAGDIAGIATGVALAVVGLIIVQFRRSRLLRGSVGARYVTEAAV